MSLGYQKMKKLPQAGKTSRGRARCQAPRCHIAEKGPYQRRIGGSDGNIAAGGESAEIFEIAAISVPGMKAGTAFRRHHLKEQFDGGIVGQMP